MPCCCLTLEIFWVSLTAVIMPASSICSTHLWQQSQVALLYTVNVSVELGLALIGISSDCVSLAATTSLLCNTGFASEQLPNIAMVDINSQLLAYAKKLSFHLSPLKYAAQYVHFLISLQRVSLLSVMRITPRLHFCNTHRHELKRGIVALEPTLKEWINYTFEC